MNKGGKRRKKKRVASIPLLYIPVFCLTGVPEFISIANYLNFGKIFNISLLG